MPPKKALANKSTIATKRANPASGSDSDSDSDTPVKHHKAEGDDDVSAKSQTATAAANEDSREKKYKKPQFRFDQNKEDKRKESTAYNDASYHTIRDLIDEKGCLRPDALKAVNTYYDSQKVLTTDDGPVLRGRLGPPLPFFQDCRKAKLKQGYYVVSCEVFVKRYERFLGTMDRLLRGVDVKGKPLPADDAARYAKDEHSFFSKVAVEMSTLYDDDGAALVSRVGVAGGNRLKASNNTQVDSGPKVFQAAWWDFGGGRIIALRLKDAVWTEERFDALEAAVSEATAAILQERRAARVAAAVE
jgi:hypothetical protein